MPARDLYKVGGTVEAKNPDDGRHPLSHPLWLFAFATLGGVMQRAWHIYRGDPDIVDIYELRYNLCDPTHIYTRAGYDEIWIKRCTVERTIEIQPCPCPMTEMHKGYERWLKTKTKRDREAHKAIRQARADAAEPAFT